MRSAGPPLRNVALVALVVLLLAGLPLAIWLDLRDLTDAALRRQAADLNSAITSIRGYYATNVVGRILASSGSTSVLPNYVDVPGAIPVPATLSIELGRVIAEHQ
jgi:adenylate cyclase